MKEFLAQMFGRVTAAMYRQSALQQAELELVKAKMGLEHYRAQVAYNRRVLAVLRAGGAK
jgi:hypothetical protein